MVKRYRYTNGGGPLGPDKGGSGNRRTETNGLWGVLFYSGAPSHFQVNFPVNFQVNFPFQLADAFSIRWALLKISGYVNRTKHNLPKNNYESSRLTSVYFLY